MAGLDSFPGCLTQMPAKLFGDKYHVLVSKGIDGFWNDMNVIHLLFPGRPC